MARLALQAAAIAAATAAAAESPPAAGSFDFGRFPHFRWRGRVDRTGARGATQFSLFDRHHNRPLGGNSSATAIGSDWSAFSTFDNSSVVRYLAAYPNTLLIDSPYGTGYDQRAGQPDYPALVAFIQVSGIGRDCVNRTRVQIEVDVELPAPQLPPLLLEATLAGCSSEKVSRHSCQDCAYLGLMIGHNHSTNRPLVTTFRQWNAETYWRPLDEMDLPPLKRPPKLFPLMDSLAGDDDVEMWEEGIAALAKLGFRGVVMPSLNLTRPLAQRLMGNQLTTGPARFLPARNSWSKVAVNESAWEIQAAKEVESYTSKGILIGDVTLAYMSMEPTAGDLAPLPPVDAQHAALKARWSAYLRSQRPALTPQLLGANTWAEVLPAGRPATTDGLAARRRYYWTTRFISWDSTMAHATASSAMQEAWSPRQGGSSLTSSLPNGTGADLFTYTNFNNWPSRYFMPGPSDNQSQVVYDWHEFGRLKGSALVWTEDWFGSGVAFQWSYLASIMRVASEGFATGTHRPRRAGETSFGGDIVPRDASGWPPGSGATRQITDGLFRKIMTFIGSGGKAVKYFQFGPEYLFPGNCYSDRTYWPDIARSLHHAHGLIGTAEPILFTAQRVPSEIAVLAPRSSFPWDVATAEGDFQKWENLTSYKSDFEAECYGIYLALAVHANHPIDVIDEDALTPAGLENYKVVFVTEPNLPAEGLHALMDWVRRGGTLVTTVGAAQFDRYNVSSSILDTATEVSESLRARLNLKDNYTTGAPWPRTSHGTVNFANGTAVGFSAVGVYTHISHPDTSKLQVLATFEDGLPAAVATRVGSGYAVRIAFSPGLSYLENATNWMRLPRPDEFSVSLRELMLAAIGVSSTKLAPACTVSSKSEEASVLFVETALLSAQNGSLVTLLNWNPDRVFGTDELELLVVNVSLPFVPVRVESAEHGMLQWKMIDGYILVSLPLDAADFILFWKSSHVSSRLKADDESSIKATSTSPVIGQPAAPIVLFPPGAKAPNSSYAGGYKAFRIPAIIAEGGLVLAFAEGRQFGCECSKNAAQICSKDLVLRRSEDGGSQWEEMTVAVAAAAIPGGDKRDGLWNPSPVFDRKTGTLLLLFNRSPWNLNMERQLMVSPYARETWMATSSDSGRTFSRLRNLTHLQKRTETWHSVSPGGSAIQLDDGTGTIVVPGYHVVNGLKPVEGPFFGHTFLSSDGGESWVRGGPEPIGVDENSAVPLRAVGGAPCVGQVTSVSAGKNWGSRKLVSTLPEITPTCGGLSRWGSMVLYTGVATTKPHDRSNVTLFISTDDGETYPIQRLLHEGPGGYSSVAPVSRSGANDTSVEAMCLFELSGISFVRVNVTQ